MKKSYLLILMFVFNLSLYAQPFVDFSKFADGTNSGHSITTADMLNEIKWASIKKFCDSAQGYYVHEYKDSLLTRYEYVKQGYEAHFTITSYKGMVMEYSSETGDAERRATSSYFDKDVWKIYANDQLPNLAAEYKLADNEYASVFESYYKLLGAGTRDEYGWICEYSTVGMPTTRRVAVINLIRLGKVDLLKKLIDYPNIQTALYAIDALIYIDFTSKNKITELEIERQQLQTKLDSTKESENAAKAAIETQQRSIKYCNERISRFKNKLLTKGEWRMIYALRDSDKTVKTCGNSGSYKIYGTKIADLLSDKAIADILKQYEGFEEEGYFR